MSENYPTPESNFHNSLDADNPVSSSTDGIERVEPSPEATNRLGNLAFETSGMLAKLATDIDDIQAAQDRNIDESRDEIRESFVEFYERNSWLRPSQ